MPTLAATEARIAQKLAQLRVSKDESETTLENATKDLVLLEEQERDLRKQVEEVEGKREWVEEFSGWAELLGTFLEEKYPKLEDIEKDSDQFMRERGEIVSTRRMADDGDDLSLFLGIPRAAEGAEKSAIDTSSANSDYRSVRRIARADRRGRLKGVVNSAATAAEEGFSTDSDLDAEAEDDYTASQHDLERRVHALMEDVKAEDFRYPERGLAVRFADWRKRYAEDYEGAFGGLALVQAWEFWARGEMVGWDPLRVSHSFWQELMPRATSSWRRSRGSLRCTIIPDRKATAMTTIWISMSWGLMAISRRRWSPRLSCRFSSAYLVPVLTIRIQRLRHEGQSISSMSLPSSLARTARSIR